MIEDTEAREAILHNNNLSVSVSLYLCVKNLLVIVGLLPE